VLVILAVQSASADSPSGNESKAASAEFSGPVVQMPLQTGIAASYLGVTVKEVQFPNLGSEKDQNRLRQLIVQQAGTPLDREQIRQSLQRLYATGRFADISAEVEPASGGQLVLSFVTKPNYFVGSVDVLGLPNRPTRSQVLDASKLQLGELFNHDRSGQALENIKQLMEENGYYQAQVETVEQTNPEMQQIAITFVVHAGPQAKVGEVAVSGSPGYVSAQIQDIAQMHPGDLVSAQRVSDALNRLRKKYQKQNRLLARVFIRSKLYQPGANRVGYTFEIQPGPKVEILAQGFKLRRSVLKQNVPVFEESAVDDDLLNEGRQNLLNYMQSRGYFAAKVAIRKETKPNGTDLRIVYVIDPRARHRLAKIFIQGNTSFPTEELRRQMRVQETGRAFANGRYSQSLLAQDLRRFEQLYKANGFRDVKVTSRLIEDYAGRENDLALEIDVDEGARTLVGAFHMVGNQTFPEDQFRPGVIQTAPGQPFSEAYIAQDRDNVLNYYLNRGFPRATFQASATPIAREANRMDVTFTIHEGEQVFVDQVYVSGLQHTKPFVVKREMQTQPGDPLSQIDMMENQRRLYDLGIFNQVDTAVQNPNGNEHYKNVLLNVQEAKRYTFNYGFGFEFQTGQPSEVGTNQAKGRTGVSPRGSLEVNRLNFRGRDQTISFKADVGGLQQRGLITYAHPRWNNSPAWKLSLTGFYDHTLDVTTFTSDRLEGSVQAEQTISKASSMVYRFTYRRVKASDLAISPEEIPLLSLPVRVGEPNVSYLRNTRDNDLETTKGTYNSVDAGVASSYFGSQADFSRVLIQNSTYHAFGKNRPQDKKFVFARSIRIGLENVFGNTLILPPGYACPQASQTSCPGTTVIPLAERLFAGGGNSHRGFGLNQAGPRDPTTGFPLGGSGMFVNSVELRLPPANLPYVQDNLSFALFEDMGNVFKDGRTMLDNLLRWKQKDPQSCLQASTASQCDFSYVSHAVGIGVRYKTPIGPVRFDFGYNLNPPAFPSCQATPSMNGQAQSPACVAATKTSSGVASLPYFVPQHLTRFNVYFSIGQTF
jgi:outer membrane protein assembly complex protein YaeT